MSTFHLAIDDRTEEELAKAKTKRKQRKCFCLGKAEPPMDTEHSEDHGDIAPSIGIRSDFSDKIQGKTAAARQSNKFDLERLFDAVSSGDDSKLEGLEDYLCTTRQKLTSRVYLPNGKTVLMKALLNLKNGENKTVEYLLDIAEKNNYLKELVDAECTDGKYKGQTALHIAIERRNKHYVELLIQKGANVKAKACGTFFQPLSKECFYFGEFPLSLAACTNQKDIVDLLMDKADVRWKDSLGNTVLHALVMVDDKESENTDFIISMYDHILIKHAVKNPHEKKLENIKNNQGLTSIKLAAKLGKIGLLEHILHREFQQESCRHLSRKFTEWAYGPVSSSLYDLDSVDTYEPNSVLELVVYGPEIPNRMEMLQIEPLNKLLEDKWNRFGKWIFLFKFIAYIIYLIIFTAVSYHREEGTPLFPVRKEPVSQRLLAGQVVMAVGSLYFFISVVMDIYKKRPSVQTLLVDGYSDLLFFLQAVLFMICAGLYILGMQEYLAFLVLSVALCWVNLLYFSRGSQTMGIYNIMIQRIFLGDILRFLFVYMVYLFGFSAAVVTLLKQHKDETLLDTDIQNVTGICKDTFKTMSCTTLELFKFTIGMGNLEFTEEYEYQHIFYVLLISYIVLTYILLLNMLIAVMSKTVDDMSEDSTNIWKLQRAITNLDMESYMCRLKLRSGVSRNLSKKEKEDKRWCLRVEEVDWKNWNRSVSIINEDPGECNTVTRTGAHTEPSLSNVSRLSSKRRTVQAGQETEPLTSSSV